MQFGILINVACLTVSSYFYLEQMIQNGCDVTSNRTAESALLACSHDPSDQKEHVKSVWSKNALMALPCFHSFCIGSSQFV